MDVPRLGDKYLSAFPEEDCAWTKETVGGSAVEERASEGDAPTFLSLPFSLVPEPLEHADNLFDEIQSSSPLLAHKTLEEGRPGPAEAVAEDRPVLLKEGEAFVEHGGFLG